MSNRILVFYGSYRSNRMGVRLAEFVVERLQRRGQVVELIDAKAVNLPMLDRMYKEYPPGEAPKPLQRLAEKIRDADGFIFVTSGYNWYAARTEKPDGSFSGGVVLAPRCDRELFGRTFVRRTRCNRLARHTLRDGDGGGLKHDCRWSHWAGPSRLMARQ
jgi:hypothetical protein